MRQRKSATKLTALTMTLFVSACGSVGVSGAGCSAYESQALLMPDPDGLSGAWLRWVNETDAAMWTACDGR